jgi:hypothetical protein
LRDEGAARARGWMLSSPAQGATSSPSVISGASGAAAGEIWFRWECGSGRAGGTEAAGQEGKCLRAAARGRK